MILLRGRQPHQEVENYEGNTPLLYHTEGCPKPYRGMRAGARARVRATGEMGFLREGDSRGRTATDKDGLTNSGVSLSPCYRFRRIVREGEPALM
jgi:hypothetical protein